MSLPDGVVAATITVDGTPSGGGSQCTLPSIAPGKSVTVVVGLTVDEDAQDGEARFDVTDDSTSVDLIIYRPQPGPTSTADDGDQPPAREGQAPDGQPTPADTVAPPDGS